MMPEIFSNQKRERVGLAVIAIALFTYIILRAILVSFTHDEAYTTIYYILHGGSRMTDITYTNNHLLNSILSNWSFHLFGPGEFSLRLPNVLSGGLFLYCAAKILLKMRIRGPLLMIAFLFLTTNVFVFDFFSLCRGYGLSMGLLLASLLATYTYFEKRKFFPSAFIALATAILATIANYTLINYALLLLLFFSREGIRLIVRSKPGKKISVAILLTLLLCATVLLLLLRTLLHLKGLNNFDFGGHSGFWTDTVFTLSYYGNYYFGNKAASFPVYYTLGTFVVFLGSTLLCLLKFRKSKLSANSRYFVFLLLILTGCAIATVAQHVFFKIPYSTDRAAIYFIPMGSLFFSMMLLHDEQKFKRFSIPIYLLFVIVPFLSFLININLRNTLLWPTNSGIREAMLKVINDSKPGPGKHDAYGITGSFDQIPSLSYYLFKYDAKWLSPIDYKPERDHYLFDYALFSAADQQALQDETDLIGSYDVTRVLRRKNLSAHLADTIICWNTDSIALPYRTQGEQGVHAEQLLPENSGSVPIQYVVRDTILSGCAWLANASFKESNGHADAAFVMHVLRNGNVISWHSYMIGSLVLDQKGWFNALAIAHTDIPLYPGDEVWLYVDCHNYTEVQLAEFSLQKF